MLSLKKWLEGSKIIQIARITFKKRIVSSQFVNIAIREKEVVRFSEKAK